MTECGTGVCHNPNIFACRGVGMPVDFNGCGISSVTVLRASPRSFDSGHIRVGIELYSYPILLVGIVAGNFQGCLVIVVPFPLGVWNVISVHLVFRVLFEADLHFVFVDDYHWSPAFIGFQNFASWSLCPDNLTAAADRVGGYGVNRAGVGYIECTRCTRRDGITV